MSLERPHAGRSRRLAGLVLAALAVSGCQPRSAPVPEAVGACDGSSSVPASRITLPGRAFQTLSTPDACWIFVSMHPRLDSGGSGLAVLKRTGDRISVQRIVPGPPSLPRFGVPGVFGLALTHDNRILIVAALDRLSFFDLARLTSGAANPLLGELRPDGAPPGYFNLAITANDKILFVTDHNEESITAIDLAAARQASFARIPVVGKIQVGYGPGSVALSRDDRYLYATTQIADPGWHWPNACRAPGAPATATPNHHPRGAVHVIDVAQAIADPTHSVVMTTEAGCDPVRLALSPTADRAYVTARSDNALLAFDTDRLRTDSSHALIGRVLTHTGPVGIAVLDEGRKVAVANALRFTGVSADSEVVSIIDATAMGSNRSLVIGNFASDGSVDIELTRDGRTLVTTHFERQAITLFDVSKLPFR